MFAALLLGMPLSAQAQPAEQDDPRIITVAVGSSGFAHVPTSAGVKQTLFFRQGTQIQAVTLSDPLAYSVDVAGSRDMMTVQALRPAGATIMSVKSDVRTYEIELAAQPGTFVPSVIRLADAPAPSTPAPRAFDQGSSDDRHTYKLSGAKALWPDMMSDDGQRTYLEWSGDRALPATFAMGPGGVEQMVDGYMRGDVFTVDRVYPELIFRVDREMARARRKVVKAR